MTPPRRRRVRTPLSRPARALSLLSWPFAVWVGAHVGAYRLGSWSGMLATVAVALVLEFCIGFGDGVVEVVIAASRADETSPSDPDTAPEDRWTDERTPDR